MFGYNIWHTLFLPTEVFWPWPREPNCPSKFSTMDDFYFEGGHPSCHLWPWLNLYIIRLNQLLLHQCKRTGWRCGHRWRSNQVARIGKWAWCSPVEVRSRQCKVLFVLFFVCFVCFCFFAFSLFYYYKESLIFLFFYFSLKIIT